jgi:trk system potassium uptake protein TrkH
VFHWNGDACRVRYFAPAAGVNEDAATGSFAGPLALHPRAIQPVRFGGLAVPESVLEAVLGFMFIYVVSIVSLTLLLSATGLEVITAFSAIVACINNTGPGLNLVGPATNYAVLTDFQTWVCSFTMLLGRLEIFSLLVVLTPAFWRR